MQARIGKNRLAHKGRTNSLTWSEREIGNTPQVLWQSLTTQTVLNRVIQGQGFMFHMIRKHGSCNKRQITCIGSCDVWSVIEGVHHHHQVKGQGESGITHIAIGPKLRLVSPTLRLHARISWTRIETGMRRVLPTMAWGMMQ